MNNVSFPPILDTSSGDIVKDFFNPTLAASVRYDRGLGFISASWLRLASLGMADFAANSGRARWVLVQRFTAEEDTWPGASLPKQR
jgi:hypothetical protein